MMRTAIFAAALALAACAPEAHNETPPTAASAQTDALTEVLTPVVSAELGQPVALNVQTSRIDGDWGWLIANPTMPDGAPIDWSQTNYASRYENGVMDESGATYALLRRENGEWRVVEFIVAPTDVAYLDWPARHGAPPALMGLE